MAISFHLFNKSHYIKLCNTFHVEDSVCCLFNLRRRKMNSFRKMSVFKYIMFFLISFLSPYTFRFKNFKNVLKRFRMASNNHKHLRFSFKTDHSTLCFSVTECDNRKYGDGCQKSCGQCVNKTQCDHVIGTCPQGCEVGYKGQICDQGQLHVIRDIFETSLDIYFYSSFSKRKKKLSAKNYLTKINKNVLYLDFWHWGCVVTN